MEIGLDPAEKKANALLHDDEIRREGESRLKLYRDKTPYHRID
jgi:hypothetical protein